MPRLVYRAAARRDIAEIAGYIERESQSRAAADSFIDKLTDYCERIARLPGLHGARDMDAYFIQHSDDDQQGD